MKYSFDLTDELKIKIRKLSKNYPKRVLIINKKIKEILKSDGSRYKNLKHGLKEYKRVHINSHFVWVFKVKDKHIDFNHHDNAY